MKICIFGAGAVGGYLGVLLKEGGADVSLIARGAHLEAIKTHGLKLMIAGKERIAHMPATSNPAELGPQDYVIVALKSHQAWEAADRMKPLLGRDTAVVTAHNGCLHLEVAVTGRSAHAAIPSTGIDALEATSGVLNSLYSHRHTLNDRKSQVAGIGSPQLTVGLIQGVFRTPGSDTVTSYRMVSPTRVSFSVTSILSEWT